mgnify:CR=1 FL=1
MAADTNQYVCRKNPNLCDSFYFLLFFEDEVLILLA